MLIYLAAFSDCFPMSMTSMLMLSVFMLVEASKLHFNAAAAEYGFSSFN